MLSILFETLQFEILSILFETVTNILSKKKMVYPIFPEFSDITFDGTLP